MTVGAKPLPDLADWTGGQSTCCKTYQRGCHRAIPPAKTLANVRPMMKQMGITRIANVTGLDHIGLPVFNVIRPNSRSVAVFQGKGIDLDAARASGLMEAVETFHAERIDHPLKHCSLRDLTPSHRLVDIDRIPKIAGSRYHPAHALLWIEGCDLISRVPLWLPYELVHADYRLPLPAGSGCFPASTNGLASGNHLLEAICHGLAEVVERDATAVWNQLEQRARARTRIALQTIDDPTCFEILERIRHTGLTATAWETTTDLGIPAFYCMITGDTAEDHLGVGAGCHPTRQIALARALMEAAQVRMTYITGARDDLPPVQYSHSGRVEKLRQARALIGSAASGQPFSDGPSEHFETFEEDLAWMLRRLQDNNIEQVIVIDLTRSDLALPVVRVVVPGLEAPDDDEDYVPGPRALAARKRLP